MPSTEASFTSARPRFRVDGVDVPALGEGTLALQVHLPMDGMACVEAKVQNWGPDAHGAAAFQHQELPLGAKLEVFLGETAENPCFEGEVTALEERYGEGAPQLVILAEDRLHRLARIRKSQAFVEMTLDAVVQQVAQDAGLQADVAAGSTPGTWLQHGESHLAFLARLLTPRDVALRFQEGKLRARPEESDGDALTVDAGRTADRVRIIADLNRQPAQVAVHGWNVASHGEASGEADALSPAPQGRTAKALLGTLGWKGDGTQPHPFPQSQGDAQALAKARFDHMAKRFLHGEVVCRDALSLRGGKEVVLAGVSPRLAGRYRVVDCWHVFDASQGLVTRMRVERPDLGENAP